MQSAVAWKSRDLKVFEAFCSSISVYILYEDDAFGRISAVLKPRWLISGRFYVKTVRRRLTMEVSGQILYDRRAPETFKHRKNDFNHLQS